MADADTQAVPKDQKVSLPTLTAMVIAWTIAGAGILMLAFVFQRLAIGFLSVLSVLALVSYGVLPQNELAAVDQPSMGSVLEYNVGHWGAIFIRVGVVLSVLGAYLAWTLMSAEIRYIPAQSDDMPRFLARTNSKGAPVAALILAAAYRSEADDHARLLRGRRLGPRRRVDRGPRVFMPAEAVLFGVLVLGAVAGVLSLATGAIEI